MERLAFGLVPAEELGARDGGLGMLMRWLGERVGVHLVRRNAESYDALESQMREGLVQVAWLPPLLFVRLERAGIAAPLVENQRDDGPAYVSTLIVRPGAPFSELADLSGKRAAWVDPLSATGYIVPRLELAAKGLDPRQLFSAEVFHGSHTAAVRALLARVADVAATYARLDAGGEVLRGGWTDLGLPRDAVRVLHSSAPLPPDLIAVRRDVPEEIQSALAQAFVAASHEPDLRPIVKRVLGVDAFVAAGIARAYDGLRQVVEAAASSGMIEASAIYMSTEPPPT